jgi:hypothetical protein
MNSKNKIEINLLKRIMRWHRGKANNDDGNYDCLEIEHRDTVLLSDSYEFNEKGETRVVPKEIAQKERAKERCYICQYLRGMIREREK